MGPVKAAAMIRSGFDVFNHPLAARNYRLMKIIDDPDFSLFGRDQGVLLFSRVNRAISNLDGDPNVCSAKELVEMLSGLNMSELMGKRQEIMALQRRTENE